MKKIFLFCLISVFLFSESEFYHFFKEFKDNAVVLKDGSRWTIGWFYRGVPKNWTPGDRLKIQFHSDYSNDMEIQNIDRKEIAWGTCSALPLEEEALVIDHIVQISKEEVLIITNRGWTFSSYFPKEIASWEKGNALCVFHRKEGYTIYNSTLQQATLCSLIDFISPTQYDTKGPLALEARLNQKVVGQCEATKAVANALLNYYAGLNNPNLPIQTFLFLGPMGVGKTELAKALAEEVCGSKKSLFRFSSLVDILRLKGGQLTNALSKNPQSVILLDEIENAHPEVPLFFLPALDEGVITDFEGKEISCNKVIFIITSNLFGSEIADLFNTGCTAQQILNQLEPKLQEAFSSALYGRVQPILFHPLNVSLMDSLVDLMLRPLIEQLRDSKMIELVIDESAKSYLTKNGYHPSVGARPLRSLIQREVTPFLSKFLLVEEVSPNSRLILYYSDSWGIVFDKN